VKRQSNITGNDSEMPVYVNNVELQFGQTCCHALDAQTPDGNGNPKRVDGETFFRHLRPKLQVSRR
jgi:hypothetical protein